MGIGEMVLIVLVFIIVFGPNKLPQLAKDIGRIVYRLSVWRDNLSEKLDREIRHHALDANQEKAKLAENFYKNKQQKLDDAS